MKKIIYLLAATIATISVTAQNTQRLTKQKDGFQTEFTYVGEVKDNKPNGKGLAIYESGDRLYGDFKNGLANGRCIFLYKNKRALVGNFVNGLVSGQVVFMLSDGTLYIGSFSDNNYNGYGKKLTKENLYSAGNYVNGKREGRSLEIGASGYIFDGMYADDKRNGEGVQYEPKQKVLFEGTWKNDDWVGASTTSLNSFIKRTGFAGFTEDDRIVAGRSGGDGNLLNDSCLVFWTKTNERLFGNYKDGFLTSGFHSTGDSIRYLGDWSKKGGEGYGIYGKTNQYLGVGNFVDGLLDGNGTYLSITGNYIYDGVLAKGSFTGKGVFVTSDNRVITGNFTDASLNGTGSVLTAGGYRTEGTYEKGNLIAASKITTPDGDIINCQPKTFGEALNILAKQHQNSFSALEGNLTEPEGYLSDDALSDVYTSDFTFPGSVYNVISDDLDSYFYIAKMLETTDVSAAIAKYKNLCDQVSSSSITSLGKGKKYVFKVSQDATFTPDETDRSTFYSLSDASVADAPYVQVSILKEGSNYSVYIRIGDK